MITALQGGWRVSVTPRPLFTPGKDSIPILQEAGWAPGPVWTGAEKVASNGIRSLYLPARSQSLYRLSYRAHFYNMTFLVIQRIILRNFLWSRQEIAVFISLEFEFQVKPQGFPPPKNQFVDGAFYVALLTFWCRILILILKLPVYKMWIIQEPNTLELWNKLHFEEKTRRVYSTFKIFSIYICWINI